jgi:hypothetical protein
VADSFFSGPKNERIRKRLSKLRDLVGLTVRLVTGRAAVQG